MGLASVRAIFNIQNTLIPIRRVQTALNHSCGFVGWNDSYNESTDLPY